MVNLLATASAMKTTTLARLASTTSVAQVVVVLNAKDVAAARRRLACACVMLHTTVPVVREVKAQRRAAFHAPIKTALLIAVVVVVFATKLPANALALLSQDNTSMVLHAKQHAGQIHTLQTGRVLLTSGVGPPAKPITC
jgi:hypothetical protein